MTLPKKITLFYGHVASNIGDLAINRGTINLLRSVLPDVSINVVLIDADASEFLAMAKSSFDDQGDIRFSSLKTHGEKAPLYLRSPEKFFEDAGGEDSDVILLSAGEHLFSYQHEENAKSLFWRVFPAFAAKYVGKKCILLPSTLGPFETDRTSALLSSLLELNDAFAVRESRSWQLLKTYFAAKKPLLLDPAFFLDSSIGAMQSENKYGATALVMRSEGWGIRLSKASCKEQTERFKASGYEDSRAFGFSLEFATRLLNTTDDLLRVFVQTTADQELADALAKRLPEFLESGRLTIERPYSVEDYLTRLAEVDRVISNRFHALILGMVVGRQVHGLYFDVYGQKIPGLFNLIGVPERCHNISRTASGDAVITVLGEISKESNARQKTLQKRIERLRRNTTSWLSDALQKSTQIADAQLLLKVSASLGVFADDQLKSSVVGNANKQIERTKKLAQTKEAQWPQQRQQLEGELLEAISENRRLIAVNQAQLEALQLELPNTLSNKIGEVLIESANSPVALAKLPLRLYRLWRGSKSQQPPEILGGDSFSEVLAAYGNGGFDAVEGLFASLSISPTVIANAYAALARHLKQTDAKQACEAALQAYTADPKPFRRKWLAFRLYEAGKVLDAETILDSLPRVTDLSPSEVDRAAVIRRHAQDERKLAAFSMSNSLKRKTNDVGHMEIGTSISKVFESSDTKCSLSTAVLSDEEYLARCRTEGAKVFCQQLIKFLGDDPKAGSYELIRVGKMLSSRGMPDAEYIFIKAAKLMDPNPSSLRALFCVAQRSGYVQEACAAIQEIELLLEAMPNKSEAKRLEQLKRSVSYQLSLLDSIPQPPSEPTFTPCPGKVCYMLHNSLPFSSGGYATRSHGILTALSGAGLDVIAITRPGFPLDTKPELKAGDIPDHDVIDGVCYERIFDPLRNSVPFFEYVPKSADAIEAVLRRHKPSLLMSASNYIVALPALIAARRAGIPFFYDVRGFWEVTRLSREKGYETSATYKVQSMIEARVANQSDRVFTLTEAMREELICRGVTLEKIQLMPNACDPERFIAMDRDGELTARLNIPPDSTVIGYIGTFVDYEGLVDLAVACGLLKTKGINFRLLLVGNENTSGNELGPISQALLEAATKAGYADWLIMPGRVPHEEVESYYSLIDIAPFPRKPWPVCEMVSPMKPLEAFAMEKAVVVSSVRALQEMVKHEETGLVFQKGNVRSLADVLERLVVNPKLRRNLGKNARKYVQKERTWAASTEILATYVKGISQAVSPTAKKPVVAETMPVWWKTVPYEFRSRCQFRDVTKWNLSDAAKDLRSEYESRFGKDVVAKRIPLNNWQRADICSQLIASTSPSSVLDIGSELGEFVNVFTSTNPTVPFSSVDVKDYALWFDHTGRVERIYKSIFNLGRDEVRDVVTCMEVIEHLPPERLDEAIRNLRSLAKRKLFVSVPFMEPLPLSKGHYSRFEDKDLLKLFPDAKFSIFGKGGKSPNKVLAWIMCEIDCETA